MTHSGGKPQAIPSAASQQLRFWGGDGGTESQACMLEAADLIDHLKQLLHKHEIPDGHGANNMSSEYGWLIEQKPDGTPGPKYYDLDPNNPTFWTLDHNEAMRFARKVDAERLILYLGIETGIPVEHAWDSP